MAATKKRNTRLGETINSFVKTEPVKEEVKEVVEMASEKPVEGQKEPEKVEDVKNITEESKEPEKASSEVKEVKEKASKPKAEAKAEPKNSNLEKIMMQRKKEIDAIKSGKLSKRVQRSISLKRSLDEQILQAIENMNEGLDPKKDKKLLTNYNDFVNKIIEQFFEN